MLCEDLEGFIHSLKHILNKNAIVIVSGNVQPTVGVVVRTQFDDHSYIVLRKKPLIRACFENNFELLEQNSYDDWYPDYATAHDLVPIQKLFKFYYLEKAISKLIQNKQSLKNASFRLRDRHLFYQVFRFLG
jgi:hypothetical protein